MSATTETIAAMGQDPQYQARCKPCTWSGDLHHSRLDALREQLAHDAATHATLDEGGTVFPVVSIEEILNQLEGNAPKLAPVYAAHMNACVDAGFTREEALLLTSDWARVTLWGAQL